MNVKIKIFNIIVHLLSLGEKKISSSRKLLENETKNSPLSPP